MQSNAIIGGSLMVVGAITFIWFMAAYQVPALQELALLLGGSLSAAEAWIANVAVSVALTVGAWRVFAR